MTFFSPSQPVWANGNSSQLRVQEEHTSGANTHVSHCLMGACPVPVGRERYCAEVTTPSASSFNINSLKLDKLQRVEADANSRRCPDGDDTAASNENLVLLAVDATDAGKQPAKLASVVNTYAS